MGWSPGRAAVLAIAAFFIVNSAPVLIAYPIALYCRRRLRSLPQSGILRICAGLVREWLAFLAFYLLIQPFEGWWMGSDAVGRVGERQPVVLLVHGYLSNRGLWWRLRRRLRASGFAVATVNLEPPFADIDLLAEQLHVRIEALIRETGVERVALVAHSMGGLTARAYLRRHGGRRLTMLVTLGSPHHGSRIARLAPGRNARQMQPESVWLRQLGETESFAIPVVGFWSSDDELVVPQDSCRLAGAREITFAGLGHLSMPLSRAVAQRLQAELSSAGPAASA
jgi:triacylglycerol lipase